MDLEAYLVVVGGTLQAFGVLVTGWGAVQTWNAYRPDEALLAPIISRLTRARARVANRVRKILRLPPRVHVITLGVVAEVETTASVRVSKQYGLLETGANTAAALRELDRRTRETMEKANDLDRVVDEVRSELRAQVEKVKTESESRDTEQVSETHRVATGGIRGVLWGLALTLLGIVVQTVGSLPLG